MMEYPAHPGIDLFIKDIEALPPGHFVEYKKALVLEVFGTLIEAQTWCTDHGATLVMDADDELVNILCTTHRCGAALQRGPTRTPGSTVGTEK